MKTASFETRLLSGGHLYCPEEFAQRPEAGFHVLAVLPDEDDDMIERAAAADAAGESLSEDEISYFVGDAQEGISVRMEIAPVQ